MPEVSKCFPLVSLTVAGLGASFISSSTPVAADAFISGGGATIPSYEQAGRIASNFAVGTTLKKAWGSGQIPRSARPDVVGAFRFICGAGQILYDDPIVYPGQPGRSHLHQFYGNTAADAHSTFASLRSSGDSTCNNMGNGTAANRSAYWIPAMLDGKGHVVMPDYVSVYYKREPLDSPACDPTSPNRHGVCIGIPNGLKFISGFDMSSGKSGQIRAKFKCVDPNGRTVIAREQLNMAGLKSKCVTNGFLAMAIRSGHCWNGQLDSADHRSHVVGLGGNGGARFCPRSHPYYMPQFTISTFYHIREGDDLNLWSLSSDAMYPKLPKGSTSHFDYFEGWDETVKDMWIDHCIGRMLNCSGGDLGNGQQLKGAAKPKYGWTNPERLVPIPKGGMRM
jgi:hypothetical protein